MRKRGVYVAAGVLVLLLAFGVAAYLYRKHQGRDIRGSSSVEFVTTEAKQAKEPPGITWPMYGYNAARLRAPLGFKLRPPYRRAPVWTFRAGALLEFPPVIAYGLLYIVNNRGTVFALDEQRGKPVWKYHSRRCSAASPAVGDHLVFVAPLNKPPCNASHGVDGKVIAFDAETGRIRWQRTIGPSESSPLFADKLVIVGDWSHDVYAFTAASGNLRWHFKAGGLIKGAVSLSGNRVYFGSYDTHVYALDLHTGKQVWRASSQPRIGRDQGGHRLTRHSAGDRRLEGEDHRRKSQLGLDQRGSQPGAHGRAGRHSVRRKGHRLDLKRGAAQAPQRRPAVHDRQGKGSRIRGYRSDGELGRLERAPEAQGADRVRLRAPARVRPTARVLPLGRHRAEGDRPEPALGRSGLRRARGRLPVGLGLRSARLPVRRWHRAMAADLYVRDSVWALDGLPRVHPQPHPGGLRSRTEDR